MTYASTALDAYLDQQDDNARAGERIAEEAEQRRADVEGELLDDINAGRWSNTYAIPGRANLSGWGKTQRTSTTADWVQSALEHEQISQALVAVVAKVAAGPVGPAEHIEAKAALQALLAYVGEQAAQAVKDEGGL